MQVIRQYYIFLAILWLFTSHAVHGSSSYLVIMPPTVHQEATSIWRTIDSISFFESQGYEVMLPSGPVIESLIKKAKNGDFSSDDFSTIYALVENEIYDPEHYHKAIEAVRSQQTLIDGMITYIDSVKRNWDFKFKLFEQYTIQFTLYGTGGSYDPDTGNITILTNQDGQFRRYSQPANTIIHEVIHIGVENSIVQKYQLTHVVKEDLIDAMVLLLFSQKLPNYVAQKMGEIDFATLLPNKDKLNNLNELAVANWLNLDAGK